MNLPNLHLPSATNQLPINRTFSSRAEPTNLSVEYSWIQSFGYVWITICRQSCGYNKISTTLRLPLSFWQIQRVIECRLQIYTCLHCGMGVKLTHPRFRMRNVIPQNSPIIRACERGDSLLVRELLQKREAYINDTTEDNKTLLSVTHIREFKFYYIRSDDFEQCAISSENSDTVELLLKAGCCPNMTWGQIDQ